MLDGARNIRCYSLDNNFAGKPLPELPQILGEMNPGDTRRPLVQVSQIGYLRHELRTKTTKLIDSGNNHFTIRVHSNLWFSFQSGG